MPNGKVIQITIEQYLEMTDEDIQYMMSVNFGDYAASPWHGASISRKRIKSNEETDTSIDYTVEDEEKNCGGTVLEEDVLLDEFPDISDDMTTERD